jgi:hypothetical protein
LIRLFIAFLFQAGEKIALSRRVDKHWRLIGWGQIRKGTTIEQAAANNASKEEASKDE